MIALFNPVELGRKVRSGWLLLCYSNSIHHAPGRVNRKFGARHQAHLGCQDMCYTLEFEKYSVTTWFGLLNARDVLAVPL